jgi:flagellar biosynthesis/type III secretory pathway chaperone
VQSTPPREKAANQEALPLLLVELEAVLRRETEALKKLDRAGIDLVVEQKLKLCEDIAKAGLKLPDEYRDALERIRRTALRNQMLLAHARDTVRQVLGIATGQTATPFFGGMRLDVRG